MIDRDRISVARRRDDRGQGQQAAQKAHCAQLYDTARRLRRRECVEGALARGRVKAAFLGARARSEMNNGDRLMIGVRSE